MIVLSDLIIMKKKIDIVSKTEISLMNSVLFIIAEFISPAILAAIAILKIFEPTMLPIIKSVLSFLAD